MHRLIGPMRWTSLQETLCRHSGATCRYQAPSCGGASGQVRHMQLHGSQPRHGEDVSNDLIYFYDPVSDLPYPHHGLSDKVNAHNHRELLDWAQRRQIEAGSADSGALAGAIQDRREQDMLRAAYVQYMKELSSSITRECTSNAPPTQRLLGKWIPRVTSSINLLQARSSCIFVLLWVCLWQALPACWRPRLQLRAHRARLHGLQCQ